MLRYYLQRVSKVRVENVGYGLIKNNEVNKNINIDKQKRYQI